MIINQAFRGTISMLAAQTSVTATISTVNVSKCQLCFVGVSTLATPPVSVRDSRVELTNSTTITAAKASTNMAYTVGYDLVEWI